MVRLIFEIVVSVVVALFAARALFDFFFDDWSDYLRCVRARFFWLSFRDDREERTQALTKLFLYKALIAAAGLFTFFGLHKLFG